MTASELRKKIESILRPCGNSEQESAWIIERAAVIPSQEIPFVSRHLSDEEIEEAEKMVSRRLKGEPLQYILGDEYFGDILLKVGPGCLIPRPETWGIVEFACRTLPKNGLFCELGTGSGAISIAVARERTDCRIFASEISPEALYWARRNLNAYELPNMELRQGSLFDPFPDMKFDLIAANLPYIPYEERENLQREVRDYEPETALFADDSGTAVMKAAIRTLKDHWSDGGSAIFEMAPEQIPLMTEFAASHNIPRTETVKDCFGIQRFLVLRNHSVYHQV